MHKSNNTAIYRLYDTGFKVVLHPNPGEEHMSKLRNEQEISQFLPWSCRKRQALGVTTFEDRPALSFKWANGITLSQWLQKVRSSRPPEDMNIRIRAAMAIAKTLSDFHAGGVVHNGLTPDNIVLSPSEGAYVATLIDLASAAIYWGDDTGDDVDPVLERKMKEVDLKALGLVLNELFWGSERPNKGEAIGRGEHLKHGEHDNDSHDEGADGIRRKRGKPQAHGEGLPLYLGALISALLENTPDARYESAKDVFNDLKVLAEDQSGSLMQSQLDYSMTNSRLRLRSDGFYGRRVQMSVLMHLFESSVADGKPSMAMISGYAGTG